MQEELEDNLEFWEVPEIDLNLRHYNGHPSDVIKKIKADIVQYVNTPGVPQKNIEIYSAIYNALNYYKDISYIPSAEYGTGETFLTSSLRVFNEDYEYLSQKYDSDNPYDPKVINFSGRIKSPLSFMNKVREKITEYVIQGRDLRYFNESLRDLIGMRIIIDPPAEVKAHGEAAEDEYVYKVFYDLLDHRGISKSPTDSSEQTYKFLPVNSRYDQYKLERIKETRSYSPELFDEEGNMLIFIPKKRIPEMEEYRVDRVVKDYIRYPKYSGYQSLHTCIVPSFSDTIERQPLVKGIIPPKNGSYAFEYQCRSARHNEFAEHGLASHKSSYKPSGNYHRLQVPFYLTFDELDMQIEDVYDPDGRKKSVSYKNKLRLRNFGESYKKYYGHNFEDFFGISFKKFRDNFNSKERNLIIARKAFVDYDEETDTYSLIDAETASSMQQSVTTDSIFVCLTPAELEFMKKLLEGKPSTEPLSKLFDHITATDNLYAVSSIEKDGEEEIETTRSQVRSIKIIPLRKIGGVTPTKTKYTGEKIKSEKDDKTNGDPRE